MALPLVNGQLSGGVTMRRFLAGMWLLIVIGVLIVLVRQRGAEDPLTWAIALICILVPAIWWSSR